MSELIDILSEEQFKQTVLNATLPVLVDFWAPWCGPCKAILPIVSSLAKQYDGKILFVKINVDQLPKMAETYNVGSIPHVLLLNQGKELGSIIGLQTEDKLKEFLDNTLFAS